MKTAITFLYASVQAINTLNFFPEDPDYILSFSHWTTSDGYLWIESTVEPRNGSLVETV